MFRLIRDIPLITALLAQVFSVPAAAADIWQWADEHGQRHFGDAPPPGAEHAMAVDPAPVTAPRYPPEGLRKGELERLRRLQRELQRQTSAATASRRRTDRQLEKQRSACRDARASQRSTRDRTERKEISNYLRKNCW